MKKIFAFTMIAVSVIAALLFMETLRLQNESEKIHQGTFAKIHTSEVLL